MMGATPERPRMMQSIWPKKVGVDTVAMEDVMGATPEPRWEDGEGQEGPEETLVTTPDPTDARCPNDPTDEGTHWFTYTGRCMYCGKVDILRGSVTIPDTPQPQWTVEYNTVLNEAEDAEIHVYRTCGDSAALARRVADALNGDVKAARERDDLATTLATYRDALQAAVDWMDNPDGEPSSSALVDRWRALLSDTPNTNTKDDDAPPSNP